MTPQEFKAWFDGFTEALDGAPNKAQWTRIKARVAEIDGKPVTERVYVDRYWNSYAPRYYPWTLCGAVGIGAPTNVATPFTTGNVAIGGINSNFNSLSAMNELGRIDASNTGVS